jgi:DNA-binding transcriptional ArsR family regulator
MFQNLDPLLHSQLRLAIISLLVTVEEAEFSFIKEKTNASAGNISVQLEILQEAKYINIEKTFKGKYPLTKCSITKKGIKAFEDYVKILQQYIKPDKNTKA